MKYFTPQNLLIAGVVYWFLFRGKINNAFDRSAGGAGLPDYGEGYP
jgi:hypothetical protein